MMELSGLELATSLLEAYRNLWEDSFYRLDAYLKTTQAPSTAKRKRNARKQ